MKSDIRLFADANGVWCEQASNRVFGIHWDEIYSVSGHKIDGKTKVFTCVVLDFENGHLIELFQDWSGFGQVISALSERLSGIDHDWFQRIERLGIDDPLIEVWHR